MSTNALGAKDVIAVDTTGWMTDTLEALGGRLVRPIAPVGAHIDPLARGPIAGHAEDEEAIS